MVVRYLVIFGLFLAVAVAPALLGPPGTPAAPGPPPPEVPSEALEAIQQGRYWRASRILREYLGTVPDATPEAILLTAQAEAGWGGWSQVEALLSGQAWLDTLAGGYGWNLLGRSRLELGEWEGGGEALSQYLAVAVDAGDRERGLAELRRGLALSAAGQAVNALDAFDRAAKLIPQIGDWTAVFAAEAAAEAGDTAAVRRHLASVGDALGREWGWRLRVRAHRNADDPAAALAAAEDAAGARADASGRAEAWTVVGDLRLLLGDTAGARGAFRRSMEAAPSAGAAVDAARKLAALPGLTVEEQFRIGRIYLRHGNLDRGIAGLEAYLDSDLGSAAQRAEIRLDLGQALYNAGRYARAERQLLELADEAPSARIGAEALYLAGRAQYRQGRDEAGRATFVRTGERFPDEAAAARALFLVADLDHDDGELASAREFYRRAIEIKPDIDEAGLARMRLGGMELLAGNYGAAAEIFERYRRQYPEGRRVQQATYWAAKAYLELGETSLAGERLHEVRRLDPFSYYGIRAAELLGEPFWDVPLEHSPPQDPAAEGEVARALVRIDLLRELGRADAVDFEVDRVKHHFMNWDAALYALAEAFNARGFTFTGIQLGWEIFDREGAWNLRLLRIIYPFPYRELILAEARERDLDPYLVAGLVRQESMFTADISSPAGAIGLMQIMPNTGRGLARGAGMSSFETELLERPEINLHLGTAYLAQLMDRFRGRLPAVLAAYNAGPHRVRQWRERYPEYGRAELFAERIPYGETRHYVKVVQENARLYAALYAAPATPSKGE